MTDYCPSCGRKGCDGTDCFWMPGNQFYCKTVIDLGCGKYKHRGSIGIDITSNSDADIIHDLNTGIPFKDSSVDEVYARHFIEHSKDLDFMMKEINRVCKNGARVHITVPNFFNPDAVAHPQHNYFFSLGTFDSYRGDYWSPKLFDILKKPSILACVPFIRALPPFRELNFELEVVK